MSITNHSPLKKETGKKVFTNRIFLILKEYFAVAAIHVCHVDCVAIRPVQLPEEENLHIYNIALCTQCF